MDPQSILIGLVVCVLSAIIIYLITAFTMKEKTFDEVLEEQRRRQEEEKPKSKKKIVDVAKKKVKKEPVAKEKVKPKVETKKDKEKDQHKDKENKMVNLEIEPEIIEAQESVTVQSIKKSKKVKAQKPILANKDEQPLVSETTNTKVLFHREVAPKDEIALKHVKHDDEKAPKPDDSNKSKKKSDKKKEQSSKADTITEVVQIEVEKTIKSEKRTDLKSNSKKTDKNKNNQESTSSNSMPLINSIKNASLNDADIQSLIEVLLDKQSGTIDITSEWNKKSQKGQKGDGLALLKQQVEEKERALQQEQQIAMASNSKVKEIRQELNAEKTRHAAIEKAYTEKLESQSNEMNALKVRIQHTHDQHVAESNNLQARLRQLEQSNDRNLLQTLQNENKILQDTLRENLSKPKTDAVSQAELNNMRQKASIMEKELGSNAVKLNASENSRKLLEAKVQKYEEQIRQFESGNKDTENVLTKKLEEVNKELRRADTKNSTLNNDYKKATADLQRANGALKTAESECYNLKKQLQELNQHLSSPDVTKDLENKLQQATRKSSELEGNVKNLEKQLNDSNRSNSELQKEIEVMKHENMALAEEMKTTKERQSGEGQEAVPNVPSGAPNGDIHKETADKNTIKLDEHESILAERMKEVTKLTSELANQKSEIKNLQEQLEGQKKKNNELREKNWKAMEALDKTEKSLSEKVESAVKNTRDKTASITKDIESLDKGVIQRLFPKVSVSEKLGHKEWMSSFEKQANVYITQLSSNSANLESKVKQLEETNKKLSTQTRDLQKIIDDTESKLRHLQKSVETEEKMWKDKLEKALSSKGTESSSQVKELEAQVTEYRSILASTESNLKQLSEKVEKEEILWQSKLQSTEEELEKTKKELSKAKEDLKKSMGSTEELNDLDFAYRCVEKSLPNIINEMEVKVDVLEKELQHSEKEKQILHEEIEEAKSQVIVLEKQIETSSQISVENEEYKRLYEAEKKKSKELSTNVVKLNGIIKTGQDALSQEQKLVKQLQEQIDTSSGSVGGKSISSLHSKLADKERQLEREIASNNQLKQKLAQLGVMAASPSKDNGTSV